MQRPRSQRGVRLPADKPAHLKRLAVKQRDNGIWALSEHPQGVHQTSVAAKVFIALLGSPSAFW
jgi:hypothetical protein